MGERLIEFVRESNRIEGILREPTDGELDEHVRLRLLDRLTVADVERFVREVAARPLRDRPGLDVSVGDHRPPPGGPEIRERLHNLLCEISFSDIGAYHAHVAYELLHPFMDGNGRSGRAIWAWVMDQSGHDPFALPFLHRFYYQALDASREAQPASTEQGEGE